MARDRRYHKVRDSPVKGDRVRRPFSGHVGTVRGYQDRGSGKSVLVDWGQKNAVFEPMSQLVPVELVADKIPCQT